MIFGGLYHIWMIAVQWETMAMHRWTIAAHSRANKINPENLQIIQLQDGNQGYN